MIAAFLHVLSVLPDTLTDRTMLMPPVVGVGLFVGFLMIATAKLLNVNMFQSLLIAGVKMKGLNNFVRESFPLLRGSSILLLFNYCISTGIVLYTIASHKGLDYGGTIAIFLPVGLLGAPVLSMLLTGWLTGELRLFIEPIEHKVIGANILGILFFVIALISTLYQLNVDLFLRIVIWVFAVESVFRIFKSIRYVSSTGVSWYYIILYFCTLEILPLGVIYYELLWNFSGNV